MDDSPTVQPRPRLILRFALYSGLVLLAAGVAIFWAVNRQVAQRAERRLQDQASSVAQTSLRHHLFSTDFSRPVPPRRRAQLDRLFRSNILIPGVVGARLVNRHGVITYAALHRLIGTRVAYSPELRSALAGGHERRVTHTVSWRGRPHVKVVQTLVPVRAPGAAMATGTLELDQDYRLVNVSTGDARRGLAFVLVLALLVLYLSLFPILRRVTRELQTRTVRLRELADERGRLLEGERAARADAEFAQHLLAEQNERLRELDRLKDEFVSLVSHELRTPLTSIRGYIELLLDDGSELTESQRRFLGIVDRNSERLLALVSDLLFLAQIEAGKLAIDVSTVDLGRLVAECIEASSPDAEARGIQLSAQLTPLAKLEGDPARLSQVLDNLVSNALKFTPAGGRVEVRLAEQAGAAVLEVVDTGIGIPADEQQRLFERFFRSSRATETAIPGSGLGLTITKAIVERHGGRIEIESVENEGTTVRVVLPFGSPSKLELEPAAELAA